MFTPCDTPGIVNVECHNGAISCLCKFDPNILLWYLKNLDHYMAYLMPICQIANFCINLHNYRLSKI